MQVRSDSHADTSSKFFLQDAKEKPVKFRPFFRILCPCYKTDDAQAYFVDQWELDTLVNLRNGLKPTRFARRLKMFQS